MRIRLENGLPVVSGSITMAGETVIDLGALELRGPAGGRR